MIRRYVSVQNIKILNIIRSFSMKEAPIVTELSQEDQDLEWKSALPYKKIPSPNLFYFLLNNLPGGKYNNVTVIELYNRLRDEYGDLIKIPGMMGHNDILLSFDPVDFEKIYRTEGIWPVRRPLGTIDYYREKVRPDIYKGIGGLVAHHGEKWHKLRTMVNPVLLQPKTVRLYINKVDDVAREYMTILSNMRDKNSEVPPNFGSELNRLTLEFMGVIALDTRLGVLDAKDSDTESTLLLQSLRSAFELMYRLEVEPSFWKLYSTRNFKKVMAAYDFITETIMKHIDAAVIRLENNPTTNVDDQSVLEKLLKIDKHIAIVMAADIVLSGVDTTSSSIIGTLYSLAKSPDKQTRLREEIMKILPHKDSCLTSENMQNFPYLRAVIKEGLRMYSPVPGNNRTTGKDIVLQGYQVPKGVDIMLGHTLLQNDDNFFAKANEFIPERWLQNVESSCRKAKDISPFIYLPFGHGPRTCVGRRFAHLEIEIVIARIIRQFQVEWHYPPIKYAPGIINIPTGDIKFKLKTIEN